MDNDLDFIADAIQNQMWEGYSKTVIDHAMHPRNIGDIKNADGYGSAMGDCGDNLEIWLEVRNGVIQRATFWTDGCHTTIAAASMITEMAKSKRVPDALAIDQKAVLEALEGLPEDSLHCAQLASNTLREAVKDYLDCQREPWRKNYRKPTL